MKLLSKLAIAATLSLANCQPAYSEEPSYTPLELELVKTAYGFGFCHIHIMKTDWLKNRAVMAEAIGEDHMGALDAAYERGRQTYNKRGLKVGDREACISSVTALISGINKATN